MFWVPEFVLRILSLNKCVLGTTIQNSYHHELVLPLLDKTSRWPNFSGSATARRIAPTGPMKPTTSARTSRATRTGTAATTTAASSGPASATVSTTAEVKILPDVFTLV